MQGIFSTLAEQYHLLLRQRPTAPSWCPWTFTLPFACSFPKLTSLAAHSIPSSPALTLPLGKPQPELRSSPRTCRQHKQTRSQHTHALSARRISRACHR